MDPMTFNLIARLVWLLSFGLVKISGTMRNPVTGEVRRVGIAARAQEKEDPK